MKRFRKIFIWVVVNAFLCMCIYLHCINGQEWAGNVMKFYLILNLIMTLMVFCVGEAKKQVQKEGLAVNSTINMMFGLVFAGSLAAFGLFFYAGIDILATMLQLSFYPDKIDNSSE